MTDTIRCDVEDGILTICLDRPARLNAFNAEMRIALLAALDRADADDAVRAIIVTGTGRAFCSGADLKDGAQTFTADAAKGDAEAQWQNGAGQLSLRIFRLVKPIIAAINGPAVGFGVTMTLAMDIRLASDAAIFSIPFPRRGIVPEAASTFLLPRIVGIARALDWSLTGRTFDSHEALAAGLVNAVFPPEDLLAAARVRASEIALGPPVAVAMTRRMLWDGLALDGPLAAHLAESRAIAAIGGSVDSAEAINAFLEKRDPRYAARLPSDLPDFVRDRLANLNWSPTDT